MGKDARSKLKDRIKQTADKWNAPLWKGPEKDGITYSMLSAFLCDRERFRVKYLLGYRPHETFNVPIEYGHLWHVCEEHSERDWRGKLSEHVEKLLERFPYQKSEIVRWKNICACQFSAYLDHWKESPSAQDSFFNLAEVYRREHVFQVSYELPNGRVISLRGKVDGIDFVPVPGSEGYYIREHKTKSTVDREKITKSLHFDLQTLLYAVALEGEGIKPAGILYNLVKRPLSGGRGSIVQHKPTKAKPQGETFPEYLERLREVFREYSSDYFQRWTVQIEKADVEKFKVRLLNPLMTELVYWYDQMSENNRWKVNPWDVSNHWAHPYGVRNVIDEGIQTDYDNFLATGDTSGLTRTEKLFGELE